ncbi:endonuclease related [Holotrichia oblita]|uniref:Endonuclease related n=1 Tax=Holotrichia oblita TaxID=644536 RepID=A0ACB9TPL5_HOLOL|nr:endonuclease related [Holotrichia oblita]
MKGEGFNALDITELYKSTTVQSVINSLVGLPKTSEKYISKSHQKYIARGHLTPKADFIYGAQQKLTFYYANAVPQWQMFNARNWYAMELSVRDYASSKQLDLEVYTGSYQVQWLPHESTGKHIGLYLSKDKVPVPRLLWKVLYNRANQTGIVLIGVNNPYFVETKICRDISHRCTWVNWDRCNVGLGCGYCCEVDDFRKTVTSLPDFRVTKVL